MGVEDDLRAAQADLAEAIAASAAQRAASDPVNYVMFARPTKPLDEAVVHTANAIANVFIVTFFLFIALIVVLVVTLAVASC